MGYTNGYRVWYNPQSIDTTGVIHVREAFIVLILLPLLARTVALEIIAEDSDSETE